MDEIPCPVCPLGELEITETRKHLHCATIEEDEEWNLQD